MDPNQLLKSAVAAQASGRHDQSIDLCRQVLTRDPANVSAKLLWGLAEAKAGRSAKAIGRLEEVVAGDPFAFQALLWLSIAHRRLGHRAPSIQFAEKAVEVNPQDPQAISQLGMCYLDARLLPEAEAYLRAAAERAPAVVQIHASLSHCLFLQGRAKEAADYLSAALDRLNPAFPALMSYSQALLVQEYPPGATECARRALAQSPNSAPARLLLSRALMDDSRVGEAREHLRAIVEAEPENADAVAILGTATQALGAIEEASRLFRRSLELNANQGYAYFALLHNRRATESDREDMEWMVALTRDARLPPRQLSYLEYGLAKGFEDLGEFENSMERYDRANLIEYELKFKGRAFDRGEYAERTERIQNTFTREFLDRWRPSGSDLELPIFVVGMPRSGTTLVEQILSSHPEVGGAGEQAFWPNNWRHGMNQAGSDLEPDSLRQLAVTYCDLLLSIAPGKRHVVDKLPGNRSGLGILHLAFPRAKIIHIRRHPVDTCLSIYATPNRALTEFAHDRGNIVFAYREYRRIMEHWQMSLPLGSVMEVDYEELVANGEPVTRAMIEFLGLGWSDRCLRPEANVRSVMTPSVWQVRQPLYRTSTERWRKFEPWLGVFRELLPA